MPKSIRILIFVLAFTCFVGFAATTHAALVSVSARASGGFGSQGNPGSTAFVFGHTFTGSGEMIMISASGTINLSSGARGIDPEGITATATTPPGFAFTISYTPLEESLVESGELLIPRPIGDLIKNVGALIGAFIPASVANDPMFSPFDEDLVALGIPSTDLFLIGSGKTITAPGPGSLYLGINEWFAINNSGSFQVTIDPVPITAKDLLYTPVTPCRIVDTRKTSAGIIDANTDRDFRVSGPVSDQGGNPAGCPSPLDQPLAAHINMIAVNPAGKGNLQAFPVGAGTGAGLSVNYNTIDTNLANAGTVKTVIGPGPDITVASNFSSAHTVIDVLGYYYPDEGFYYTPVDPCRIVDTRKTSAGIIDTNTQRDFRVSGPVIDQGGNPASCPSTLGVSPEAAHVNMVAVNPTGKGNLQAFPKGAGTGAGLSVNYNTIDTNFANAGTVKTSPDITVASNFSSAHTVIDVLGYYSEEEDLLYTPVIPCRIVDTRKTSAGMIDANTQRDFRIFGPVSVQGGNSAGCSAPMGEPLAAHINMVAVNPTGKGNLQAFPVGAGIGAGLSVNYNTIDTNLANAGTIKTVTGSGADFTVASNFSSAHTVIDVLGYYYPAP